MKNIETTGRQIDGDRYRLIVESATEGMMVIQNDSIVFANPTLIRMSGVSREELYSSSFDFLVHPEDRDLIQERYTKLMRNEPTETSYDFRIVTKDDSLRWLQITSQRITWEGEPATLSFVIDVTRRKLSETQLEAALENFRHSESRYGEILNAMQEAFYEVDLKGNFTFFNTTTAINLGYSHDELLGLNFRDIVNEENAGKIIKTFNDVYRTGEPVTGFDWEIITKDGEVIPVETSIALKCDDSGTVAGFTGVTRNIAERKKNEEKLRYLSIHDPLTGTYNRVMFDEEMNRLESGRFDPIAIVVCDLDGLKAINDTLGHGAGDNQIRAAANFLKKHFRSTDIVARIGGDEFAVLLPQCQPGHITKILKHLRESLGQVTPETGIPLLMSAGYATRTRNDRTIASVLREADRNMYREKNENRSTVTELLEGYLPDDPFS